MEKDKGNDRTGHLILSDSRRQMGQADTGLHQPRDEKSTLYEADPGPYGEPIGVLAWSTVSLC